MNARFIFCFFLITFCVYSFGQTPQRVSKVIESVYDPSFQNENFVILNEKTYEYDEKGNLQLEFEKQFNLVDSSYNWLGTFYEYNSSNQLQKKLNRKYNPDVDLFITLSWLDYAYNDKGCLIGELYTHNNFGVYYKKDFERDKDCKMLKQTYLIFDSFTGDFKTQSISEREYLQDEISYNRTLFQWSSTYDSLLKINENLFLFNEYKRVEFVQTINYDLVINQDTFSMHRTFSEFDSNQNLTKKITEFRYAADSTWTPTSEKNYYNTYDDWNDLIEVDYEVIDFFGNVPTINFEEGETWYFGYTCSETETVKSVENNSSGIIFKTETIYEGENPCFEVKDSDLEISIFPNPTAGQITIESPIFQSGNTQISIFSIDGKVLLQKTEVKRCDLINLNLPSDLQNGFYFLELSNQDYHVTERVVVSR